jgi:hypothetical protein
MTSRKDVVVERGGKDYVSALTSDWAARYNEPEFSEDAI